MAKLRQMTRPGRWLLLAVLWCVLAARVAVPGGWMPMATPDGSIAIVPCTGMGAMTMSGMGADHHAMTGHPGDHDKHDQSAPDHPCSGAGVAAALEIAGLSPALAAAAEHARLLPRRPVAGVGRGLAAPPPPATGPPASA